MDLWIVTFALDDASEEEKTIVTREVAHSQDALVSSSSDDTTAIRAHRLGESKSSPRPCLLLCSHPVHPLGPR